MIAEFAKRLACFGKSVAALDTAPKSQTVVVIDRQQVKETRRSCSALSLPDTGLFRNGNYIPRIETTVTSAAVDDVGRCSFVMLDRACWTQTDDNIIVRQPWANDKAIIKRAGFGSFDRLSAANPA